MPHFTCPQLPLDGLLRRAAARAPHAPALTTGRGTVTFGQLDAHADRIARFLAARTAGRGPVVVGVAAGLDALFPAALYGTSRSGNTVALINPLADESTLHHLCTAAGIEIALVPAAVAEPLARIRGRLPLLHTVLVTDADAGGAVPEGALALHTVLDTVPGEPYTPPAARTCPRWSACSSPPGPPGAPGECGSPTATLSPTPPRPPWPRGSGPPRSPSTTCRCST